MSDFDEGMVLRRIGELIEEGELPPIAHGLLRLLGIAIEQEAALEQAQAQAAHLRRALVERLSWAIDGWAEANDRAVGEDRAAEGWTDELKELHDRHLIEAENIYEVLTGTNRADIGEIIDWVDALAAAEEGSDE